MSSFEKRVRTAFSALERTLAEIQEGLPWPSSEHAGFRLEEFREAVADLSDDER